MLRDQVYFTAVIAGEMLSGDSHVKVFGNLWYSTRLPDYYVELTLAESGKHYLQENGKLRGQQ